MDAHIINTLNIQGVTSGRITNFSISINCLDQMLLPTYFYIYVSSNIGGHGLGNTTKEATIPQLGLLSHGVIPPKSF